MNCWLWDRHITKFGYGRIKQGHYRSKLAHVLFYEVLVGPKPKNTELHHVCANKACCNPDHLQPVTRSEHVKLEPRGNGRSAITHCPRGHPYDENNTGWNPRKNGNAFRFCKICNRQRVKKYQNER